MSGGSTMFRDFGRRLQRDLKRVVDHRLKASEEISGGRIKVCLKYSKRNSDCMLLVVHNNYSLYWVDRINPYSIFNMKLR